MSILNLTQHVATAEQMEDGVFEPMNKIAVQQLLNFEVMPDSFEIRNRAHELARIAKIHGVKHAMIGGAPYLMSALEAALTEMGIRFWYSYSERVSQEETLPDGSVKKTNVFRHVGFIG